MSYREIAKILGFYFLAFAAILMIPLFLSLYYQFIVAPSEHPQPHSTFAFLDTIFVCAVMGIGLFWIGRHTKGHLFKKESMVLVVLVWCLTPAIAAMPFIFSDTLKNPFQAYFETVSGLTTTGSTVMQARNYDPQTGQEIPYQKAYGDDLLTTYTFYGTIAPVKDPETGKVLYEGIEAVGKALLFWRSFLQALGGIGVVILFVAILPSLGVSGKLLFQAEMTGPIKDSITPRVAQAAWRLWMIYLGLSILQFILLMITNSKMEWLDAATITFSTLSTGGFSIRNSSIGYYDNTLTDWVIILFMILGATNFSVYYYSLRGMFYRIYKPELWLYLGTIFVTSLIGSWYLIGYEKTLLTTNSQGSFDLFEAMRHGTFQIVSALTSTGFATANYDFWPYPVQTIMLIVMFVGGMSGSTGGGIKMIRHYIMFHIGRLRVESLFQSKTVRKFKVSDQEIGPEIAVLVLGFFWTMICVSTLGVLMYVFDGIDPITSLGLVGCMINNTGMSFRIAGPIESCAFLTNFSLVISSLLMLLGRLEFFVFLAVLMPSFWKEH